MKLSQTGMGNINRYSALHRRIKTRYFIRVQCRNADYRFLCGCDRNNRINAVVHPAEPYRSVAHRHRHADGRPSVACRHNTGSDKHGFDTYCGHHTLANCGEEGSRCRAEIGMKQHCLLFAF